MKIFSWLNLVFIFCCTMLYSPSGAAASLFYKKSKLLTTIDSIPKVRNNHFFMSLKYGLGLSTLTWNGGTSDQKLFNSKVAHVFGVSAAFYPKKNRKGNILSGVYISNNQFLVRNNYGTLTLRQLIFDLNLNYGNRMGIGIDAKFDRGSKLTGDSPFLYSPDEVYIPNRMVSIKANLGFSYKRIGFKLWLFKDVRPVFFESGKIVPGPHPTLLKRSYSLSGYNISLNYLIFQR
jgi:hypothetical protein